MSQPQKAVTEEECRAWIEDKVFVLRSSDYGDKYPKWPGMVGLEIEMGVVVESTAHDPKPKMLPLRGPGSLTDALIQAQKNLFPEWVLNFSADGDRPYLLTISLPDGGGISFEPGGQVEFSSRPYPCLADALARMRIVQGQIRQALEPVSARLTHWGINPWLKPDEIGLQMTKPRYIAMNEYFSAISENGPRMMRQTCTIQVNLDFGPDDATLAKRYLLANLIAPVATAIFGHSPFVDGKDSGLNSYRANVWHGLDSTRTGFPKGLEKIIANPTRKQCAAIYADSVLDARVVFVAGRHYEAQVKPVTFREWLHKGIHGEFPTQQDFETHMSLHFPEVRARGFMEMRSVDCQSAVWQDIPAIFYCGLIYQVNKTQAALDLMLPHLPQLGELWKQSVHGLKDPTLRKLANDLVGIVANGLSSLSPCFKGDNCDSRFNMFQKHFVARGRNPADDLRDLSKELGRIPTPEDIRTLDERWKALV